MSCKINMMTSVKLSVLALAAGFAMASAAPALAQGTAGGAAISGTPKSGTANFNGKWLNATPMAALKPIGGGAPPLTAKGKAEYAKNKANPKSDPINECLLHGQPRLLFTKYPFLIMQYDTHVDFVHEVNHTFLITYFGEKLDPEADPLWLGHTSARWDGKTLVLDGANYNDQTWLDYTGLPHGTQLKTEERFKLSADGKTINGQVTITDPEYFTKPWTAAFTLKKQPGNTLRQFACMADHKM